MPPMPMVFIDADLVLHSFSFPTKVLCLLALDQRRHIASAISGITLHLIAGTKSPAGLSRKALMSHLIARY